MTALAEFLVDDEVLQPVDIPEPITWGRIGAWATVGAVIFCWSFSILPLFIQQWLAS